MSLRYSNGAIIKPGFNPVLVPGAPTIGLVTPGNAQVIVAFTAPTDTGGSAITSYQVVSSPESVVATGASSPITVTGLTNGTAYTFRVAAINSYGAGTFSASSASATPVNQGQQAFTTVGTFTWVAPSGVTSVSVVAVGGGSGGVKANAGSCVISGGGGAGGGLGYINNYSVTPGSSYTVVVGVGGCGGSRIPAVSGGDSYFVSTGTVKGGGAAGGNNTTGGGRAIGRGGNFTGTGGGNGGQGGNGSGGNNRGAGGAGAGGYAGTGGDGATAITVAGACGAGGGGGGGGSGTACCTPSNGGAGGGGGVGILGQGTSGAGGAAGTGGSTQGKGGGGGSSGTNGTTPSTKFFGADGGLYGGGGAGGTYVSSPVNCGNGGTAGGGAVRIIWPGATRSFPSTNTGNL